MLKVTKEMLDVAGKLMNNRNLNHIKTKDYDYFTSNHQTVAIVKDAGSTRKIGAFNCSDFVIVDSYDFK